ncbi:hypothetical protein [Anaeromyxobacter terrae]|uniref:hypothetical protein n=1 Tax=Anaeromyxobacter terrae TaxID=2925406 RepID=UPI001F5997AE|nr:hypothetical protein [Anaeromyxobacter sp. SG22]
MPELPVPTNPLQVADDKYSAVLANDVEGPRVVFRGTISTVNPAVILNPFVDAVHGELAKLGRRRIRVDLRELEFCNSSGFKAFIHWIERIASLPEAQRYTLHFLSNPVRKWQRTSLLALSCYGVNSVSIE